MPASRTVFAAAGRAVAIVATLAAGAAVAAAAVLVPWPEHRVEPSSVVVAPAESREQRVCPGPLLTLADETADATTPVSLGAADTVTAVEPPSAEIEQQSLGAPENPLADSDGGPVALQTRPGEVAAGLLAGAQSQVAADDTVAGLAVAACREPVAGSWLVGGSTAVGRVTLVLLANPSDVAATVDVRVHGETGPVDAPSALGIQVPAHEQRVVSLAGLAPDVASPVVEVTSTGGRIAATLEQTAIDGLVPAGVEFVGAAAAPARSQVIPGVLVPEEGGVESGDDHAEGDAFPALRLFAPGDTAAQATVRVVPAAGGTGPVIDVELEPGQVLDVPLGVLQRGMYSIAIESDAPVVAAARTTIASIPPTGDANEGTAGDLAWFTATNPLIGDTAIAVPAGPDARLALTNPGDADVEVRIDQGDRGQTVVVSAGESATVPLDSDDAVVLLGAEGLHASISFADERLLSSFAIEPPGPLDAPIRVYPG
ncbi:hypothetical protein ET445_15700 [Agromyces protaetiae]|uniref:Large extracellular alpha-helical protein n=1 Tax=Agromyces protaetiae TaxID=2509455 RepID=A0A4P6FE94_9MICO|nr:DUF5719 family protein [Agromyces protaetiae]QAY74560.1 hypothetical protein ET445_15700 [Agromyces protaetiae]